MILTNTTLNTLNLLAKYSLNFKDTQYRYKGKLQYKYSALYNYISKGKNNNTDKVKFEEFDTDLLKFDIEHPIQIETQLAYDGSVNMIFTDDKNIPRLVNSRFTPKDNNTYEVIDREGVHDTNIYHGDNFEVETSLTKKYIQIPQIDYLGFTPGGNLPCGNYHFFIKYADADGNTSDFIAETGLVSVFLGTDGDPASVHGGIRDTNSGKGVQFQIKNLDLGYSYIQIFFERDTSDDQQNRTSKYYKISNLIPYSTSTLKFNITGFENIVSSTEEEINLQYILFDKVKTLAQAKNRLFVGNIETLPNYTQDLKDISIQFLPFIKKQNASSKIGYVDSEYRLSDNVDEDSDVHIYQGEYYNSKNIYYNLGYANREIYRLGIVYIQNNGQLSSVYNIRGIRNCPIYTADQVVTDSIENSYTKIQWASEISENNPSQYKDETFAKTTKKPWGTRTFYTFKDDGYINKGTMENTRGTIYINDTKDSTDKQLYSIGIYVPQHVIEYLQYQGIIGFFFVRQKRMPLRLCQAYTFPVDNGSELPVLHTKNKYLIESFLDSSRKLTNNYNSRLREVPKSNVGSSLGAICPDLMIKMPYLNQFFTGTEIPVRLSNQQNKQKYLSSGDTTALTRSYIINNYIYTQNSAIINNTYIVSLQDSAPVASANGKIFRAKAGTAEEAWRYRLIGNVQTTADNGTLSAADLKNTNMIVRGLYSPYLGINSSKLSSDQFIDIYFPGFDISKFSNYFNIRMEDVSQYYPIGDRIELDQISTDVTKYRGGKYGYVFEQFRGDNYLCTFTWRMNRNFSDPTAPTNDVIVEPNTWKDHFKPDDNLPKDKYGGKTEFEYINRGDVNAVKLGSWITVKVESNYNLNLRSIDESNPTEVSLYGHGRGFYPVTKMSADGGFKISDSQQMNDGYNTTVGNKYYNRYPEIPYVQNNYSNRIYYSNVYPYNSIQNGYRIFNSVNFRDYNFELGSITKVVEWYGDLIAVLEHGIIYIPIQEKSVAADGSDIFINYNKILPEVAVVLTSDIGSKWIDSIVKTPYGIFGVDTVAKKLWQIKGSGSSSRVNIISDFKIEQFVNENIDLGESDNLPMLGIRNVHTHWNAYKQEVMFTFYDWKEIFSKYAEQLNDYGGITITNDDIVKFRQSTPYYPMWNIAYNLLADTYEGLFTTFYSWMPSYTFNIDNCMYSINEDQTKYNVLGGNWEDSTEKGNKDSLDKYKLINKDNIPQENALSFSAFGDDINWSLLKDTDYIANLGYIWKHGETHINQSWERPKPTHWYGIQHPFEFEFIVRDDPSIQKIWDNLQIISNFAEPESFSFTIIGDGYEFKQDKPNMFYRQEATKELWHNLGSSIIYNPKYKEVIPNYKYTILNRYSTESPYSNLGGIPKSTYFPQYYRRDKLIDDIYSIMKDSYHTPIFDYKYLSGSEIIHNLRENNFGITTHIKCTPRNKYGILRANSEYLEDEWNIQIPKINIVQKNESPAWDLPPLIIDYLPNDLQSKDITEDKLPEQYQDKLSEINQGTDPYWPNRLNLNKWTYTKQMPIRDKWIKIRIRYSGKQLAIISAIRTIYTESFA